MRTLRLLGIVAAAILPPATGAAERSGSSPASKPPNVLIFLLDDVGFGQLSSFGGAIPTPNIDSVASRGIKLTNFHTTALCSPTRAALLTGRNHHSVGTGVVTEIATDDPGYTGRVPKDKMSWVLSLKAAGYHTAAWGKWHNTPVEEVRLDGAKDLWPQGWGFEHFYGFLAGDSSQWEPTVWNDYTPLEPHAGNPSYHLGKDMTDDAIKWIQEVRAKDPDRPFFAYYATGAMHAPHHAPREYIDKYKGKFDDGWDKAREQTFARQKLFGIIPANADLPPRDQAVPAWDSLTPEQKRVYAREQEVFAGYLDFTDQQFGRVLDELRKEGILDDTIVLVTSDNGASGEGGPNGSDEMHAFNGDPDSVAYLLAHLGELGTKLHYNHYSSGWAQTGNTPFRYWKQVVHEGGVRTPFIISWPNGLKGDVSAHDQFAHVVDVGPTLLELVGVRAAASIDGVVQTPFEGVTFVPALQASVGSTQKHVQYFEMLANRGVWKDGWKAVTFHGRYPWELTLPSNPDYAADRWELYDLKNDPTEAHDVADVYPDKLAELKVVFQQQAEKFNVFPLDDTTSARLAETQQRLTGGIHEFTYRQGDIRIGEMLSPPVKGKAHTITAHVTIPKGGAEGVIVAAGGRPGGYALFVKDGKLHYASNYLGKTHFDIVSNRALTASDTELRAKFVKTGASSGRVELYVDDEKVGEGEVEQTQLAIFAPAETFDVGEDTGSPVTDAYAVPAKFTGKISRLTVTIDENV